MQAIPLSYHQVKMPTARLQRSMIKCSSEACFLSCCEGCLGLPRTVSRRTPIHVRPSFAPSPNGSSKVRQRTLGADNSKASRWIGYTGEAPARILTNRSTMEESGKTRKSLRLPCNQGASVPRPGAEFCGCRRPSRLIGRWGSCRRSSRRCRARTPSCRRRPARHSRSRARSRHECSAAGRKWSPSACRRRRPGLDSSPLQQEPGNGVRLDEVGVGGEVVEHLGPDSARVARVLPGGTNDALSPAHPGWG